MRHKLSTMTGLAVMLLLVSACGSSGGVGDIFGGGNNGNTQSNLIRGTVDYVDANNRTITLRNVSGYSSMLSNSGGGDTVRVYYDNQTEVQYQGQDYRPTDLERGDEVEVRVNESGSQLVADVVTVTRNVAGTSGSSYPSYGSTLRGTVRYIDTSRRTIELDRGSGTTTFIEYDNAMNVMYNGSTYRVADLERGDEIEVRVTDLGSNRFRADNISVIRSVSSNDNGTWNNGSSQMSTIRGTVRYVDTTRRTIELEQASGLSGFNTGAGTIVVTYGSNASVEFGGQAHPITGLERGDVVEVQVDRSSGSSSTYYANRIFLVRDVRN